MEVREDALLVLLTCRDNVEPMTGIEPAYSAWEADVLPLNYIRVAQSEASMFTLGDRLDRLVPSVGGAVHGIS